MARGWAYLTILGTITCALSGISGPLWAHGGDPDGHIGGDPRTEGLRVIELGPNSSLYLYDPVVGDVRLISSVENLGPDPMTYLDFYTLYPATLTNQEVIDLQFFPEGVC